MMPVLPLLGNSAPSSTQFIEGGIGLMAWGVVAGIWLRLLDKLSR